MAITKPRVFIIQENDDANLLLNGLLWLKGCDPTSLPMVKNLRKNKSI